MPDTAVLTGTVFDIKEFAVHDGPGMRVTVFMKGCPLRCLWCHNPEGLSAEPQLVKNRDKCRHCGACEHFFPCKHKECQPYGICIKVCPLNILKISGKEYTADDLCARLSRYKVFFERGGGVTFSGGEPTMQPEFAAACLARLKAEGINTAIETSSYCDAEKYAEIMKYVDEPYCDIKEMDDEKHKALTGVSNKKILSNIRALLETGKKGTIRMPLIPGVNDSDEELCAAADFLFPYRENIKIELLPYNTLTGAKYRLIGKEYKPEFDEKAIPNTNTEIFTGRGFRCISLKR